MTLLRTFARRAVARVHHVHHPGCGCAQALVTGVAATSARHPLARATRHMATGTVKQPIGFVGLGNMGGHMAHNLLKAGYPLVVFDLNPAAVDRVMQQAKALNLTARVAKTPLEVGQQVSTCFSMLPSSPHVREVYTSGTTGILRGLTLAGVKDALLIDSSTIDPQVAREVANHATDAGQVMVDAPVSGGVGGAESGTLTFMVGGSDAAFARAQPLLQHLGKNIVHCGSSGTGQVAKVCNNAIAGMSMIAVAEGMSLGVKLGMEPSKLAGIFNTSTARCWSSDTYNPCPGVIPTAPSSHDYAGGFATALMHKDMGLALDAAQSLGHHMPLATRAKQVYADIMAEGNAQKDFGFVYEHIRKVKA